MTKTWVDPVRLDWKTMCKPSGAQEGCSLRPASLVNWAYRPLAGSMKKML
jgi:hypothetical protein